VTAARALCRRALALLAISSAAPLAAAEPCKPGPLPPALTGARWDDSNWPAGETVRFAATPPRGLIAFAVEVNRGAPGTIPQVRLLRLEREYACNRWARDREWRYPISAASADYLFESVRALEAARFGPSDEIVLDGPSFALRHRAGAATKVVAVPPLSPAARALSLQVLALLRPAAGDVPRNWDWSD
jgi:hypothetical protein